MIYTIYNGDALSGSPTTSQINLPVGLQEFKVDMRHDSNNNDGGLTLEYWGLVLTEDVNGLAPPKVGYTLITTPVSPESKIISMTFSTPVNVVKFSAVSSGGRKLFLAVVAEHDYGI